MKQEHAFFVLGSIGMAATGLLHMLMAALGVGGEMTSATNLGLWIPAYLTWTTFMGIGLRAARQASHIGM